MAGAILGCLLMVPFVNARARPAAPSPIPVDAPELVQAPVSLRQGVELLRDPEGQLLPAEVLAKPSSEFQPLSAESYKAHRGNIWLRAGFVNPSSETVTRVLEFADSRMVSDLEVYLLEGKPPLSGRLVQARSGEATRPPAALDASLSFALPAGAVRTLIARFGMSREETIISPRLWSKAHFTKRMQDRERTVWLGYGLAAMLALCSLLVLLLQGARGYFSLPLAVLAGSLALMMNDGVLASLFGTSQSSIWNLQALPVCLAIACELQLTRAVLKSAEHVPRQDAWLRNLLAGCLALAALAPLAGRLAGHRLLLALGAVSLLFCMLAALSPRSRQQRSAGQFLLACLPLAACLALPLSTLFGISPAPWLEEHALRFALLAHWLGLGAVLVARVTGEQELKVTTPAPNADPLVDCVKSAPVTMEVVTATARATAPATEDTELLQGRAHALQELLDNTGQGFLTLQPDGRVERGFSRVVERWLGPPPEGTLIWDYLHSHDKHCAEWVETTWDLLSDSVMPLDIVLKGMPNRLTAGNLILSLNYRPIPKGSTVLERLAVVITDVTEQVHKERAEAAERELFNLFQCLSENRRGVLEFFEESRCQVRMLSQDPERQVEVRRALHTLKGNANALGLETLSEACHSLESTLVDRDGPPTKSEILTIVECWDQVEGRLTRLIGNQHESRVEMSEEDLADVVSALHQELPYNDAVHHLHQCLLQPTRERLGYLASMAEKVAMRLGKPPPEVHIEDHDLRLPADCWREFWAALGHVVRNAVDHGIEDVEERMNHGKDLQGQIWLRSYLRGEEVCIEVQDDGAGIQWGEIAAKAREAGLPHDTQGEKMEALFSDGLTTTGAVTEVSGRGVGVGAARAACLAMKGHIEMDSELGAGTCFRFRFPRAGLDLHPSLRGQSQKWSRTA